MTRFTLGLGVATAQRELCRSIMIEMDLVPFFRLVAGLAFLTVPPRVLILDLVT